MKTAATLVKLPNARHQVQFYLGTHMSSWLPRLDVPLFVSINRLVNYKTLPRAAAPWCLDSGGFTALSRHGGWPMTPKTYSRQVEVFADEVGNMKWAAPMDWMCEPNVVKKTGLSVAEHQRRTIKSFLFLRDRVGSLVIPVLQGWTLDDYLRHIEMYAAAGVDLEHFLTVGVGSVCRRGATDEIVAILGRLAGEGLRLHAFGVKGEALRAISGSIVSADSMAWSFAARYEGKPLPGCEGHMNCANCPRYALLWRERLLASLVDTRLKEAA